MEVYYYKTSKRTIQPNPCKQYNEPARDTNTILGV